MSRPFTPGKPHEALMTATIEEIVRWTGCHIATVRRWRRGEQPGKAVLDLVRLRSTGDLGIIDLNWEGWTLLNGRLAAPGGGDFDFSPGDVMSIPFKQQLIKHLQQRLLLPQQSDWIDRRFDVNEIEAEAKSA